MDCTCEHWKKGMSQIIAQAVFCNNQSGAPKYDVPPFQFCPWCGRDLSVELVDCPECGEERVRPGAWCCNKCLPF